MRFTVEVWTSREGYKSSGYDAVWYGWYGRGGGATTILVLMVMLRVCGEKKEVWVQVWALAGWR